VINDAIGVIFQAGHQAEVWCLVLLVFFMPKRRLEML